MIIDPQYNQPSGEWIDRFYQKAKLVSTFSRDPSSKVGSVIVNEDMIEISSGWNGFPRQVQDLDSRYRDRETKYKLVVHAERNAIYNACRTAVTTIDCNIFVYGVMTCHECAKAIIQSGIKRIYMLVEGEPRQVWYDSFNYTFMMAIEARVYVHMDQVINGVVRHVLDNETNLRKRTI